VTAKHNPPTGEEVEILSRFEKRINLLSTSYKEQMYKYIFVLDSSSAAIIRIQIILLQIILLKIILLPIILLQIILLKLFCEKSLCCQSFCCKLFCKKSSCSK